MGQADEHTIVDRQEAREKQAERVSEEQLQVGEDILHSYTIRIAQVTSLGDLIAVGNELTPELTNKMTGRQVEKLRAVFTEARKQLKGKNNGDKEQAKEGTTEQTEAAGKETG
jgi:hypothetical protein